MFKLLSGPQVIIALRVKGFLVNTPTLTEVRSMFREDGEGLSVGLVANIGSQNYVVRQTIGADWTDAEIDRAVEDMRRCLIIKLAMSTEAA